MNRTIMGGKGEILCPASKAKGERDGKWQLTSQPYGFVKTYSVSCKNVDQR